MKSLIDNGLNHSRFLMGHGQKARFLPLFALDIQFCGNSHRCE